MRIGEIVVSSDCKPLFDEVQAYVTMLMKDYVPYIKDLCEREGLPESGKDIFDYVWGSIRIAPEELCLLDSPLIQRLRRIKQLGFTSMVYCNANHSRFSHTIGVLEASSRMAKIVNADKRLEKNSAYNFVNIVRMATILHDAGHTFFSHVSETYFLNYQNGPFYKMINNALISFKEETGAKKTKLHELISVMMLYTQEVKELLYAIGQPLFLSSQKNRESFKLVIDYIACLIIGQACDAAILPYSSILNGPIDADKIDYLSRDSACTKVPIAVDVARLIQKLTVVYLNKGDYARPPIWHTNGSDIDDVSLQAMAINYSARKSCWQLSIARSVMLESVYYHHKKLSAEIMFKYAYESLEKTLNKSEAYKYRFAISVCDDFFSPEMIHSLIDRQYLPFRLSNCQTTVFDAIFNRNLWKRVASFSLNTLKASSEIVSSNVAYNNFVTEVMTYHSTEQQEFFERLKEEVVKIADLFGMDLYIDQIFFAFIESLPSADEDNDIDSILIEQGNGGYKKASEVFKGEPWMQGKENKQNEYFLITNIHERDIVYVALEKVLYQKEEKYLLNVEAAFCSKLTKSEINRIKLKLLFNDYYSDALDLVPNDIVLSIIGSNEIRTIAEKFKSFQGKGSSKVDEESLVIFLRQFLHVTTHEQTLKSLYSGILSVLKSTYYVNRESFIGLAKKLFEQISGKKARETEMHLIKIGGSRDSSTSWSYYFNDLPDKLNTISIESALKLSDDDILVFFDDGAYSGHQIVSIFQEYMGIQINKRATNEHHVEVLSQDNQKKLKKANIFLAYLFFNESSENFIITALNNLGLENVKILSVVSLKEKVFDRSDIFNSEENKRLLKDTLLEIGKSILATSKKIDGNYKERWDDNRVCNSSLGYNDAQQMIVFERNIPTYSLTAFWAPNGKYKGSDWIALFRRTEKD